MGFRIIAPPDITIKKYSQELDEKYFSNRRDQALLDDLVKQAREEVGESQKLNKSPNKQHERDLHER